MYRYNRPCSNCMNRTAGNPVNFYEELTDFAPRNQPAGYYAPKAEDTRLGENSGVLEEAAGTKENGVVFKHDKDGLSIHITIYNTNNNANEGSEAGLKQKAETGGQISGKGGKNANQGGQISGKCGQNANQDGEVSAKGNCAEGCGKDDHKEDHGYEKEEHCCCEDPCGCEQKDHCCEEPCHCAGHCCEDHHHCEESCHCEGHCCCEEPCHCEEPCGCGYEAYDRYAQGYSGYEA